jgi:hypothetical protein
VDAINAARRAAGTPALVYDGLLERVGDLHCKLLLEEVGDGHFSVSGVPPYLRYLLAGGSGYHRENAFRYSRTGSGGDINLRQVVLDGVAAMLGEKPPDDGHRQALLEAAVTHIGVGLTRLGGEVRMSHELATEVTESWAPPPIVAVPRSVLVLSGRVAKPWRAAAAAVLLAVVTRPSLPVSNPDDLLTQPLYPTFTDPLTVTSLEIVDYDEQRGEVIPFKVAQVAVKGKPRWSIEASSDTPQRRSTAWNVAPRAWHRASSLG